MTKFRDIDPNGIIAIVKRNPNLLLTSKENVQLFILATLSRRNEKKRGKEKKHHSKVTTTSKKG